MNASSPPAAQPVIPAKFLLSFVLVTTLFSLWGFANDITNPLVAAFKDVFVISNAQSSWVQMAFYGGYGTMAIPAALFIHKFSYRAGIIVGLILYAVGAMICVPAAHGANFNLFLIALYILTFGLAFLETTANPYILAMGSEETATRRLNFAQAFNPIGSLTGMVVASTFILANLQIEDFRNDINGYQKELSPATAEVREDVYVLPFLRAETKERVNDPHLRAYVRAHPGEGNLLDRALADYKDGVIPAFNGKSHRELQDHDLRIVSTPYMVIGFVVLGVMCLFIFIKLPPAASHDDVRAHSPVPEILKRLFRNPLYLTGVLAQTFYVGAQIMCWTFIIQYAQTNLGLDKATAQNHNIMAMVIFVSSRFICTFFLKYIKPGVLLGILACGATLFTLGAICLEGMAGLYSLILISACMSLMFPTIYGIALRGLGPDAKIASAGLILAIVGGAFMPLAQGTIMDMESFMGTTGVRGSFYLPLVCFVAVAAYGLFASTYKQKTATTSNP